MSKTLATDIVILSLVPVNATAPVNPLTELTPVVNAFILPFNFWIACNTVSAAEMIPVPDV